MEGPSDRFRQTVMEQIRERHLETAEVEDRDVEAVLSLIAEEVRGDVSTGEFEGQEPDDVLAAVEAWAALLSDTFARSFGPASPFRKKNKAGTESKLMKALRGAANRLKGPLKSAAKRSGASSWGIAVGFPWGVSVSLSWS